MRKYFINNKEVSKKKFFLYLHQDCTKVISTSSIGGLGVELKDFDQKKYNQCKRSLQKGNICLFMASGRSYHSTKQG